MNESGLPRKLRDLLHREAHLKLCRAQTSPIWTKMESDLRVLQATRPPFMALFSPKLREDRQAGISQLEKKVERLRHRMHMLKLCEPHIAKMIEQEIELLLREDCPEYIQALAALRQKEDWVRCLNNFGEKIFELTRAVGNVRNVACSGYSRQSGVYSDAATQAFTLAFAAAQAVEEEVKFANRISDSQLAELRANGIETKPLPRLPETSFSTWINQIKALPLAEAQVQFDTLLESTRQLRDAGVPELRAQADKVQLDQNEDVRNFLSAAWEQFRAEIAPEIFPGDTERLVADTERMVSTAARASVVGRL